MTTTQQGYLILADISGYTSYLAGTELDHSQAILTELLELVIERFETHLTIAKLEGDAVFAYAPAAHIQRGESLLELIEQTYVAFVDRRDIAYGRTTCTCRACKAINTLDLKFFTHFGEYFLQSIAGREELVGADVALVHRLMKNHINELTGWHGYALFSEKTLDQMGMHPEGLFANPETYEHLGEINTLSMDLIPRYREIVSARHVVIEAKEAHHILEYTYTAPPSVIWEWFNQPIKRAQWMHSQILPILQIGGRTAVGARNHCVHGKDQVVVEDILDFHPFDYYTVSHTPRNAPASLWLTFAFSPTPAGGTHLSLRCQMKMKAPTWLARIFCKIIIQRELLPRWKLESIDGLVMGDRNKETSLFRKEQEILRGENHS